MNRKKITSRDKLVHIRKKYKPPFGKGCIVSCTLLSSHSIEVKAVLNKEVLILTPLGPATAAAYLQYQKNKIDK